MVNTTTQIITCRTGRQGYSKNDLKGQNTVNTTRTTYATTQKAPHHTPPPPTPRTPPARTSSSPTTSIGFAHRSTKGSLRIEYYNVEGSEVYTHTKLEMYKDLNIVFIGEPHIFNLPGLGPGTAQHPAFRLLNMTISPKTKILTLANKRLTNYLRIRSYRQDLHEHGPTGPNHHGR